MNENRKPLFHFLSRWGNALDHSWLRLGAFCIVLSLIFVLFCSYASTPLHPYVQTDASVWRVMGRGVMEGVVPYEGLYDHKGPLLFLEYAVGMGLSHGKLGMFIVEAFLTTLTLCAAYKIARLFVSPSLSCLALLSLWAWNATTIDGGATNEAFSQPFIIWPMYWLLRYLIRKERLETIPGWLCFSIGAAGGLVTMIRMNNASVLCGMAIAALFMCRDGFRLGFGRCLLRMLAGFCAALLPFVLYFWITGSFSYFIQGCFTHNFLYLFDEHPSKPGLSAYITRLLPSFVLIGLVIREWYQRRISSPLAVVILSGALLSALLSIGGRGYGHYYQVLAPVYLLSICFILRGLSGFMSASTGMKKLGGMAALLLILALLVIPAAQAICMAPCYTLMRSYAHSAGEQAATPPAIIEQLSGLFPERFSVKIRKAYEREAENELAMLEIAKLSQKIPEDAKESVLGINIPVNFYVYAGIQPCFRYFSLQSSYKQILPHVSVEILDFLSTAPPEYLIVSQKRSPELEKILSTRYQLVYSSRDSEILDAYLYRRLEQ